MVAIDIQGLQEAQQKNLRIIQNLKMSGALGNAVREMALEAHRRVVMKTHVDTGTLRAAQRIRMAGNEGIIEIDPGAVNPQSGQYASVYGPYEHARGGEHAFYERVYKEDAAAIQDLGWRILLGAMPS